MKTYSHRSILHKGKKKRDETESRKEKKNKGNKDKWTKRMNR